MIAHRVNAGLAVLILAATPAIAQSSTFSVSPIATIQPSNAGGHVQPAPQNSAMRGAAGGQSGASRSASTSNPMGMAGMGQGMSGGQTGGMTLSSSTQQQSGPGQGASQGGGQQGQSAVRITDTGVTQRMPASSKNGQ